MEAPHLTHDPWCYCFQAVRRRADAIIITFLNYSKMIRFKALNESSSDSDSNEGSSSGPVQLTKEAQEEQLQSMYQDALTLLKDGNMTEAKDTFLSLLDALNSLPEGLNIMSAEQLKFLACKNLGVIEENNINYFMDALEIDCSDVGLWIKTGSRAFDVLQDYPLARNCFEAARILSPNNWIVMDKLMESYFVLHDLFNVVLLSVECLKEDPSMKKARVLLYESCRLTPPWSEHVPEDMKGYLTLKKDHVDFYNKTMERLRMLKTKRKERALEEEATSRPKKPKLHLSIDITDDAIKMLGQKLLRLYDQMQRDAISPCMPIDVIFEKGHGTTVKDEVANGNAEESNSQEISKEDGSQPREKKRVSRGGNSNSSFPMEFLEKRRSGRVQRLAKSSGSEQSVFESLMEMIPQSVRDRILEEEVNDEKTDEELKEENRLKETEQRSVQEIEKEIITLFVNRIKEVQTEKSFVSILDIIHLYLVEISKRCHHLNIPPIFSKLYDVYRRTYAIPNGLDTKIGVHIDLDDMFLTLVANELNFKMSEEFFLTRMYPQLEIKLDEEQCMSFWIRLLFLRGTKGNEPELLDEIIYLLQKMDKPLRVEASNQQLISIAFVKTIIGAKCEGNLETFMSEGKYQEVINLLYDKPEEEMTPSEEDVLVKAIIESESWEKGILLLNKRDTFTDQRLQLMLKCIETGERAKLNHKLAYNLCKAATDKGNGRAWCCLYWMFFTELNHEDKKQDLQMINFLRLGHDFLGKKQRCTSFNGEFLLLSLDYMMNHSLGVHKQLDDYCIDCFVCLFAFPSKKSHCHGTQNPSRITMKWEHSNVIYSFFVPEELPAYDSNKTESIDNETEGLLNDILKLVPTDLRPDSKTKMITKYISEGEEFPDYEKPPAHPVTQNLYYFLGDFYFKNKDFKKAKYFFIQDLAMNPERFDSWAGLALTRAHQHEQHMSKGDNFTKDETDNFYRMCQGTFRCFKRGLSLDPTNSNLWIEYGNLAYNVSSQMSRITKSILYQRGRPGGRSISPEYGGFDPQEIRGKQKDCLALAKEAFQAASKLDLEEEQWLPWYLLGKISEKNHIIRALEFYELADVNLYTGNANYPKRIAYHTPPNLAIEALEVHYRIHASVLKFLVQKPNASRGILLRIKTHLIKAARSTFVSEVESHVVNQQQRDLMQVSETLSDVVELTYDRLNRSTDSIRREVVDMCLLGVKRCLSRFPEHYKSMYRLAIAYYTSGDLHRAKEVLLSSVPDGRVLATNTPISGLFADRKTSNFFNGIWRIPIDEVDRPGSFPSHMFRSAYLIIRVCTALFDYDTLCQISICLSRIPDPGKKYLREGDRLLLSREAFDSCAAILRNHLILTCQNQTLLQNPLNLQSELQRVLREIKIVTDKFIKANVFAEDANKLNGECFGFYRSLHGR